MEKECKHCGEKFETELKVKVYCSTECRKAFQAGEKKEAPKRKERERVPLGGFRRKLSHPDIPGYQLRWVNDVGGRLEEFKRAGYEFVERTQKVGDGDVSQRGSVDSRTRALVGTNDDGSPMYGYLMKQRKEWYDEDQRAKQEPINELEQTMFRGLDTEGRMPDGRYIPATGPKITHNRRK